MNKHNRSNKDMQHTSTECILSSYSWCVVIPLLSHKAHATAATVAAILIIIWSLSLSSFLEMNKKMNKWLMPFPPVFFLRWIIMFLVETMIVINRIIVITIRLQESIMEMHSSLPYHLHYHCLTFELLFPRFSHTWRDPFGYYIILSHDTSKGKL